MGYKFSQSSLLKLETCDERLQQVCLAAINLNVIDFTVVWGWRSKEQQNALADQTPPVTTKRWPDSKHNYTDAAGNPLSLAVDLAPWVTDKGRGFIPWAEPKYFYYLAGVVMSCAMDFGVRLRWGGDWDSDRFFGDQTFNDLGHFELLVA